MLEAALSAVVKRCDLIVEKAADGELAALFVPNEINVTNGVCLGLLKAVAEADKETLQMAYALFLDAREHIMDANSALVERMTHNPLVMSAVQCAEEWLFNRLVAGETDVIQLARIGWQTRLIIKRLLSAALTDVQHQLSGAERPIRVEIIRKERMRNGLGRGRQTPFMEEQRRIFRAYLDRHPVCASFSAIDRARQCWRERRELWDRAVGDRSGYSSYKALAQTV